MNEANKVKLGAFILISIILLITAFISAGALRFFSPRIHAVTEVFTSVEGLNVGAPVKYLGMPVGKVTKMYMRGSDGRIIISFDIFGEAFKDDFAPGSSDGVFDHNDLDAMLKKNMLSCFVNASGLMGGSHLELVRGPGIIDGTFADEKIKRNLPPGVCYIPSNPSHIGNAIQNVSRMLEEMKSIDWNGFATKINSSLDNINTLLNKKELDNALQRFERIVSSLERTTGRLETTITQENMDKINTALSNLDKSTQSLLQFTANKKMTETLDNLNRFLHSGKNLIDKAEKNSGEVHAELKTFINNLETSVIRLENRLTGISFMLQDFSKDPGQIIHGKRASNID